MIKMMIFEKMDKWEFKTFIFQPNKSKTIKYLIYDILIVIGIIGAIIIVFLEPMTLYFLTILGLKLFFKLKIKDLKFERSVKDFGGIGQSITITVQGIQFEDQFIAFAQAESLVIYVDEYNLMPKQVFWTHHGGNNEIRITKNGKVTSFNYYIASKGDFHYMEHLVARIEEKYPPKID
mgnify:CR=1 FL=1